jgi:transketolase
MKMTESRLEILTQTAAEVRKDIVRMVGVARSGSIDPSLAITDLLVYMYWEELLILPGDLLRFDRDRFLLGMEEGVPALYAVLARRGCFDREDLWHYRRLGATLQPMPEIRRVPGIDAPTVPDGSELSIAAGLASALSIDGVDSRVFCLMDISLCWEEDFIWEAQAAARRKLGNIIQIIVYNVLEGCENAKRSEKKLKEFGWRTVYADGHSFEDMEDVFSKLTWNSESPTAVYVGTKRNRVLCCEPDSAGMTKLVNMEDMVQVLEELEAETNEE